MTERAQSITLGFVFVFAIVIATMSIVTVVGTNELRDVRDDERLNNAEKAFETLDGNVGDLVERDLPSQATEINLAEARLSYGDPVTVTVRGHDVTDSARNFSYNISMRPVVYEVEGKSTSKIVYAGGQVFRQQRGGQLMLDELDMVLTPDRTNLYLVQTRAGRVRSAIAGSTTARIRLIRAETVLYQVNRTTYDISVSIDSPRAPAWYRALDEQAVTSCSLPSDSTVTCSFTTDEFYLTVARVDVNFE